MIKHSVLSGVNQSNSSRLADYWSKYWNKIHYRFNTRGFVDSPNFRNQYQFVEDFHFAGIEFGKYLTEAEREERFAGLSEACCLLSSPLFFDSMNLGMDKHLLIGIGARGRGGKALAHFEPAYNENSNMFINVTKENGNHSFVHEWIHAVDFFLGWRIDTEKGAAYLSDKNNGSNLRRVVASIIEDCKAQMNLKNLGEYWSRPKEILARSFEAWCAFVLSKAENKEYQNSLLCKTLSHYRSYPVYPHTFNKDLDNKFILFCSLVGKALNGKSIETSMKKVASKTIAKTTQKRRKSTYILKDYDKVNQMLSKKLGLKAVDLLRVEKGKVYRALGYQTDGIGPINIVLNKCSRALLEKLLVYWNEKRTLKRAKTEFVLKSEAVVNDIYMSIKRILNN